MRKIKFKLFLFLIVSVVALPQEFGTDEVRSEEDAKEHRNFLVYAIKDSLRQHGNLENAIEETLEVSFLKSVFFFI